MRIQPQVLPLQGISGSVPEGFVEAQGLSTGIAMLSSCSRCCRGCSGRCQIVSYLLRTVAMGYVSLQLEARAAILCSLAWHACVIRQNASLTCCSSGRSSKNVGADVGASGSLSAVPSSISFWPALTPVSSQEASSFNKPPLTMTFCRSGGTPVREYIWFLKTLAGRAVSISTSSNVFLPHLITTFMLTPSVANRRSWKQKLSTRLLMGCRSCTVDTFGMPICCCFCFSSGSASSLLIWRLLGPRAKSSRMRKTCHLLHFGS